MSNKVPEDTIYKVRAGGEWTTRRRIQFNSGRRDGQETTTAINKEEKESGTPQHQET